MRTDHRRARGFALLIVLWSMVMLTMLTTQLTATGRTEAEIAANLRTDAVTGAAAAGAVYQGLYHLLDSSPARWGANGAVHEERFAGGVMRIVIVSQAGFINPNSASPEVLAALLHAVGADGTTAARIADAIVGWRGHDAQTGPGADAYRAAGLAYTPPQAPFRTIDELGLVLGMTPQLLAGLRPHLSIYNEEAVDPTVADPMVRDALEADADLTGQRPKPKLFPRNVLIRAVVTTPSGSAVRQARFRLDPGGSGAPFEVMTWEAPAR